MNDSFDEWEDGEDYDLVDGELVKTTPRPSRSDGLDGEALEPEEKALSEHEYDIISNCVVSRIYFAEVVLGVTLEDWQYQVLLKLDNGATRISIRSGNGAGKTFLLAIIILHFILFRNDVKVPVTAPSSGQLKDGLIPETRKWMKKLPDFLRNLIDTTQDRIYRRDSPDQNFVSFRTARRETPEALQGIHADNVLCVVDEASGVPDEVYEAAQGTMSTPGAIFIMISNPTRLQGYFWKSQTVNKHMWDCIHVTSFDTSRVDQAFVDQIAADYGLDSDQYRVKVLGQFPSKDEQTLISADLVTSAFQRNMAVTADEEVWGVDVGRGGDLSALVRRRRNIMYGIKTQNYSDTMKTVAWVKMEYDNAKVKPTSIFVDSIGIGAGVADRLRELGLPAVDINVSESASMKQKYLRLRDELWWAFRQWLESLNVAIKLESEDHGLQDKIQHEITAPLALMTASGKDAVESKDQMKKRGVRSPNIADAMCLTFAFDAAVGAGLSSSVTSAWKKPLAFTSAAPTW